MANDLRVPHKNKVENERGELEHKEEHQPVFTKKKKSRRHEEIRDHCSIDDRSWHWQISEHSRSNSLGSSIYGDSIFGSQVHKVPKRSPSSNRDG